MVTNMPTAKSDATCSDCPSGFYNDELDHFDVECHKMVDCIAVSVDSWKDARHIAESCFSLCRVSMSKSLEAHHRIGEFEAGMMEFNLL